MRIPSTRSPRRRLLAALCAVALAAGGAVTASTPAGAAAAPTAPAPASPQEAGELVDSELPAPPPPRRLRPVERVLTTLRGLAGADPADGRTATTASTATLTAAVAPGAVSGQPAPGGGTANTLIVYDTTGPWGWLGEAYAMQTANLSSRFGRWTARPVGTYTAGELAGYSAVIYIGSTYDEPLPAAFLADVTATTKPVLWMYNNIWQLTAQDPAFAANRGFMWRQFDVSPVTGVRYRGTTLGRDPLNAAGLMDHVIHDPGKATVVGQAVRTDGTTLPWAVRSGNLTYLGEIPYAYVGHDDRYLAFADLLFDVLAPNTPTRRRALVRIEDVGPDADPAQLRAIADLLHARRIPFSVAVYTRYRNPRGVENNGRPEDYSLWQRPQVVSALKYMRARGGTLLMHGYTHQYESAINPYDGRSGNDFEFYMAHVDAQDRVIYDGPVPKDSASWATGRINSAATDFMLSGLPVPTIFEFPHYAGSAVDYRVVHQRFGKRYERGLYFPGVLSGKAIDYSKLTGQFFPYPVRDVFGSAIVPENIGNVEPEAYNHHPVRLPEHLIATARLNLVVRDGTASFFYHPYLGTGYLRQTVDGIRALGYTFVSADSMIGG